MPKIRQQSSTFFYNRANLSFANDLMLQNDNEPKCLRSYKTTTTNGFSKNADKMNNNAISYSSLTSTTALESNTLKKYKFLGIDPENVLKTSDHNSLPVKTDLMSRSYHESFLTRKNNDNEDIVETQQMMSTSLITFDSRKSNFSSNDYAKSKSQSSLKNGGSRPVQMSNEKNNNKSIREDGIEKLNGLVLELNEIVKQNNKCKNECNEETNFKKPRNKFILPLEEISQKTGNDSKFILPLEEIDNALRRQRFSMKKCELKRLQSEQSRLMDAINNVKTKLLDIQQQKDEIIREVSLWIRLLVFIILIN